MENAEQTEDDNIMDFESGIDTWIIDKDDSVGSVSSLDKTRREVKKEKNSDKENIKHSTYSNNKSLRSFRIRKRVSYEEFSSESESESNKNSDVPDFFVHNKRVSDPINISKTSTSFCTSNEVVREIENLSSEEISSMLSEADDDSRDCSSTSNREKLLSIENVSSTLSNIPGDLAPSPFKWKFNTKCINCLHKVELCACDVYKTEEVKNKNLFIPKRNNSMSHGTLSSVVNEKLCNLKMKPNITENQSLKCDICGYLSAELLIYKSHQILFHSEQSELECEYCDYKTTQCANLATHIRVHFQMDCPYCDYHCSLKSSLESHLSRYHQNAHPYKCKTCNYSCKLGSKFYDHLQMHAEKKYQCSECKEFFSSKLILKKHIKKHLSTANVFKCRKCDLCFSQKRSLKLHMKSHEKQIDMYVCNSCKFSCQRKLDFINHSKTHTSKPYKCEKCESTFSQGNHLKLHMRIHLPRYLKCKYCTFQCIDSSEISSHLCVPVNKLYNVQKRSLHFESDDKDVKGRNVNTNVKEELKKVTGSETNILPKLVKFSRARNVKSKTKDIKQTKQPRPTALAVRTNLRCFKNETKSERRNRKLQNNHENPKRKRGRPKKVVNENDTQMKKNKGLFQNGLTSRNISQVQTIIRRQRKLVKKIKKKDLSKGLELTRLLFNKKHIMNEVMVERVAFASGGFIECFYQSQQPTSVASLQQHEERHLRRSNLLSCKFCNYKTNSPQLLKWHIDKNHTWDPAVVSKLFRP